MRILLLCEPRSGSTNLANWFLSNKNFTVLFEPISNPNTKWYKNGTHPNEWTYDTKNLLVKEVFNNISDFNELIDISDKVICLYRENMVKQMESLDNAVKTKNWHNAWIYYTNDNSVDENTKDFYIKLKTKFSEKYLSGDYFKISYEQLYYNNGFQKVLDYLNIVELKNENFPYGKKYRIDAIKTKKFI